MNQPPHLNPWSSINQKAIDYWEKMGRLNLLSGVLGNENLEREADSHFKNREAEESHVRRSVWGSEENQIPQSEEMRQTILGDNVHTSPIMMPQKQSNLSTIAALVATLAAGGIGGYAFSESGENATPEQKQPSPAFDDSSVSIGLGRIEDYIQEGDQ